MYPLKLIIETILLSLLFGFETLFPFFEGRTKHLFHFLTHVSLGFFNQFIVIFLFSGFSIATLQWSEVHNFGILRHVPFGSGVETVFLFLLFDFWMYIWHRLNHRIPLLWRFHSVHHSDLEVDASTALRFHTGEIILSALAGCVIFPVIGINISQFLIYEICFQAVVSFHHSNIALPEKIDRVLRAVIVTPNMHRVHHSQERFETDSNYASIFSLWDRVARTFRLRENPHAIKFGLSYFQDAKWQTFPGMFRTPFVRPPHQ